ncbi:MAG: sensor domain-containing diguanylate cyclase [Pseudolabrys sp.]
MLCFCLICGKVLLDARHAAAQRALEVATGLVATLTSDVQRNIESYDLSLRGVIDGLEFPEITQVSPALRQAILFDRSSTAKHLHAIVLLDENGIVRLDSRMAFPEPTSRAGRDYFKIHKADESAGIFISEPYVTPVTHKQVIAISRRLTHADGAFAGVVVGSVELSYFQELFKQAALGQSGNITLSRMDGKLLVRWPYQEAMLGRDLKGGELYKHLADAPSGSFETDAVTDGVHRLIVYSRIGDLPLVIGVGQATADIYADWRNYAFTIGSLIALLCALSILLTLYLAGEMKRRGAAETMLASLARTDGLTGLANRRHFNEAIDREWRRALRDSRPLALLMCDVDLFKDYNDRHGHQAGDNLLQAIAMAMTQSLHRATDIATRYGGDEFAILLPGANVAEATLVAEQVRNRLAAICAENNIAPASMSVGVASGVPRLGEDQSCLISAADEAAYQAKKFGRNRIEAAAPRIGRPSLVAASDRDCAA